MMKYFTRAGQCLLVFLVVGLVYFLVGPQPALAGGVDMKVVINKHLPDGRVIPNPAGVDITVSWDFSGDINLCGGGGTVRYMGADAVPGVPNSYDGPSWALYNGTREAYVWRYNPDTGAWEWTGRGGGTGDCGCINRRATVTIDGVTQTALFKAPTFPDGGPFYNNTWVIATLDFYPPETPSLSAGLDCSNPNVPKVNLSWSGGGNTKYFQLLRSDLYTPIANTITSQRSFTSQTTTSCLYPTGCNIGSPANTTYFNHDVLEDNTYDYWVRAQSLDYSGGYPGADSNHASQYVGCGCTPNPGVPPKITNLTAEQYDPTSFSGRGGVSGRLTTDQGSNWLNGIRVKLFIKKGSTNILRGVYAFYANNEGNRLAGNYTDMLNMVNADPTNGFLLFYDNTGRGLECQSAWCVSDRGQWKPLNTNNRYPITNNLGQTIFEIAVPINFPNDFTWVVWFKPALGSKVFHTGAYVKATGNSSYFDFIPDTAPVPITNMVNPVDSLSCRNG